MKSAIEILLFISILLCGCVKYSPYQITLEEDESNLTFKNLNEIGKLDQTGDTITFAFVGDTQRFYDESDDFVDAINKRTDVEFLIISGDLTDFGLNDEYTLIAKIFNKLHIPYLTVIGNHDLIYNGEEIYEEMFGPQDYTFQYKGMKFIMLNTNGREYKFNGKVPNVYWLDAELADTANYINAIVVGHISPDHDDFDKNLEDDYTIALSKWGKTILSMNGHRHNFGIGMPYNDGVTYLNSFSVSKRYYTIVRIWPNGFDYKNIEI